jgi:hypothetical protein
LNMLKISVQQGEKLALKVSKHLAFHYNSSF